MSEPLIEIVVDGGTGLGYGHISRMKTLAETLIADGFAVHWAPQSDTAREALAGQISPSDQQYPALSIVDLPYDGSEFVARARTAGRPVIALDYTGEAKADLAIRTNAPTRPVNAERLLHGLDYAIIRRDIRAAHSGDQMGGADTVPHGVLVSIGGSDLGNKGPQAASFLAHAGLAVTLVRGPIAEPLDALPGGVKVKINPPDLPALMASADWAVANAGTTVMELMYLGRAAHVLPQTEEEQRFADDLISQGAILGVGLDTLAPPDPGRQAQVALKASTLVDGRGAERISELCRELLRAR